MGFGIVTETLHPWYPTFEFHPGTKMGDVFIRFFNREEWDVFFDEMTLETPARKKYYSTQSTLIPDIFYPKGEDISNKEYPLPQKVRFIYRANNGITYWASYDFDWEETQAAFAEYFAKYPNTRARLNFRVNQANSAFTVRLENEQGDAVFIPFHEERLYLEDTYNYPTLN